MNFFKNGCVIALLFFVVCAASIACGKKGGPKPPEAFAPSPVKFFIARGGVDSIILSWEAPETNARGDVLENLSSFVLKRSAYRPKERAKFKVVQEIPFQSGVKEAPKSVSADATAENAKLLRYTYVDSDVLPGTTYDYMVFAENARGVKGLAAGMLRVTFIGESSVVERHE